MPIDPDSLPNDVATLRAMLSAQAAEMAAQRTELAAARAGLLEQRYEIEALRARLARALRVAFGRSSEKLRDQLEQLELTLADLDERIAETEPKEQRRAHRGRTLSSPRAVRCRRRCRAISSSMRRRATPLVPVSPAAASCAPWART